MPDCQKYEFKLPPRALSLIESLRYLGCSLRTALADVIDNSMNARARNIRLVADSHDAVPAIGILGDGVGMRDVELHEAIRPGTRIHLKDRSEADPGSFGRRLKNASFSQRWRIVVITCRNSAFSNAVRDLDTLAASGRWVVDFPDRPSGPRWSERIDAGGMLDMRKKLGQLLATAEQTVENCGAKFLTHVA